MTAKNIKKKLGPIIDGFTQLEVDMARNSRLVTSDMVAEWVTRSSALSSKLDSIWKEIK